MKPEQLAALTEGEQEKFEALRLMLGLSKRGSIIGQVALSELVTALADARLEIAKRKQGLKDSTEAWEAEIATLKAELDTCRHMEPGAKPIIEGLEAEVARLRGILDAEHEASDWEGFHQPD